ncbi:MAG TPA: T9SS type A sorting domain-containing protein, partial [Bacteroidales bacterium]|nr:T9SS type A sorting domain-containing protein [Bacteroidales bacterium]
FVTPVLDESTTYWLQEITQDNDVLCQSDRSEVTVYVLDVPDTVYGELSLTGCTAIEYEGVTYSNSGDYTLVYPDAGHYSADSILQLHITIYPAYTTNIVDSINLGDSYVFGNGLIFGTTVGVYTYHTTLISANGCDSLLNLTLTVEGGAGVAENSNNQWQIFPNPVTESATIVSRNGNPDFEISVFDVYGRNIISKESEGAAMELDMRGQVRGVYFVRIIENKKGTTTLKVVKN